MVTMGTAPIIVLKFFIIIIIIKYKEGWRPEDVEPTYRCDLALDALPEGVDIVGVRLVGGVPHSDHGIPDPHRNQACQQQ